MIFIRDNDVTCRHEDVSSSHCCGSASVGRGENFFKNFGFQTIKMCLCDTVFYRVVVPADG